MPINIFKPHIINSIAFKEGSTRTEEMEQSPKRIFKLSSNENLLGPSPKAFQAIRENLHGLNEYSFQQDEKLRQAMSRHAQNKISQPFT
jgi:histidinol-phosphate aminotransferase